MDGLEEVGEMAEDYARAVVPVDTGALRDSIDSQLGLGIGEVSVTVFADTDYAAYVELGVQGRDAQPYLRPSVMDHTDEYMDVLRNSVANAMR